MQSFVQYFRSFELVSLPVVEDGWEFGADARAGLFGVLQVHALVGVVDVALSARGVRLAVRGQAVAVGVLAADVPGRRLLRLLRPLARHAAQRGVHLPSNSYESLQCQVMSKLFPPLCQR